MKKKRRDSIDFFDTDLPSLKKDFERGMQKFSDELGWKFGYGEKKSKYIIRQFWRFWKFIKKDSWASLIVSLVLAFFIIKFIFFPLLSFTTGSQLPLVIVESCSMYHNNGLEKIMQNKIYADYNLTLKDADKWSFQRGLGKGDIIFVVGSDNIKVGDVIVFQAGQKHPIIHRVIQITEDKITTKGDHNSGLLPIETNFDKNQIIGKAIFRVPWLGWVKLIFFEWTKPVGERGFC